MATVPVVFDVGQIFKSKGDITPKNLFNLVCLKVLCKLLKKSNRRCYI